MKYAINGLLSLTPDGMPILGETPEVGGPLVGGRGVGEGGPRRRQVGRRVDGARRVARSTSTRPTSRASTSTRRRARTSRRARPRASTRRTGSSTRPSSGRPNRGVRLSPFHAREHELGAVFYEAAGWERPQWYEANAPLVEEYGVAGREAEWDARWWSPIINAEHLAMRERAAIFDLSAFCDLRRRRARARSSASSASSMRQMDVAVGRVVYTPVLTPGGGFRSDLTIMRLGDEQFRVVTGGAHGMADRKLVPRPPAGRRLRAARRPHVELDDDRPLGAAGARHPRERHRRRRLARGLPVRHVPHDRDRLAARARVAHLLRRRPRLGALRPDRAGRAAVGRRSGRPASRTALVARRDRRLRRRPAGSRSATARTAPSSRASTTSSRRAWLAEGEGAGLRRQGGAPAPPRGGAGRDAVHADGRRPHARRRASSATRSAASRSSPATARRSPTPRAAARTSRAPAPGRRSASTS